MEEKKQIAVKTITNFLWRFCERIGAQLVSFIVSIILARLLLPSDYGIIALITVFTSILNVFIDSGLGNALIQKKDANDIDFSTVFFVNSLFCIILYILLFITAPIIANFYSNDELIPMIRVLGITIIISGLKNVQQAYVSKKMLFKKFFYATLGGTIIAAFVGIFLAKKGYGVWALIVQQIVNISIDTLVLWIIVPWKPKLLFSFSSLKQLFSYGWKILVASLINTLYLDLRQLIIGKIYTSSDLAYYNQGQKFPQLINTNINSAIDSVLFPMLSDNQSNIDIVRAMTRKSIQLSSYVMWPLLMGLAAISRNLVTLLLSEKWLPCIPYFIMACFSYGIQPIQTANLNAIKAMGRSDIFLKLEIIKKTLGTAIIIFSMRFGVFYIALGALIYDVIASICNSFPNKKLLNYSYFDQIKDMFPSFIISLIMGIIVYFLPLHNLNLVLRLLIQVFVGFILYVSVTYLLKFESFKYIISLIKTKK